MVLHAIPRLHHRLNSGDAKTTPPDEMAALKLATSRGRIISHAMAFSHDRRDEVAGDARWEFHPVDPRTNHLCRPLHKDDQAPAAKGSLHEEAPEKTKEMAQHEPWTPAQPQSG